MPAAKAAKPFGTDSDLYQILRDAPLSQKSKTGYTERLQYAERLVGKPLFELIDDAAASIKKLKAHYKQATTLKGVLSAVLAVFRHSPDLKVQLARAQQQWYEAFSESDKEVEDRYKKNEPSEKQAAGYVPFAEIVAKRDELEKGSEDRLLLAMYTYILPLRADYNRVRLYKDSAPSKPEPNHIVMGKSGCVLHLNEYKTSATHGEFVKQLPDALCEEIHASLKKYPREWLFAKRGGGPFDNTNSFISYASRTFLRLFKKPLTISIIRHSFINTLDFNALTIEQKEAIAQEMRHTTRLQDQYRLIFKKPDDNDDETDKADKTDKARPDSHSKATAATAAKAAKAVVDSSDSDDAAAVTKAAKKKSGAANVIVITLPSVPSKS